ncbi:GNAT family N-acetyltransferase [Daejeonella oryzae]|uniref:GNAT family N-acetyltransferase n=1 Tax=Daejeonella oryzae TaxID=1122943 RepID=UPI0004092779|nr:GNAT family N-acetyltransferase [Daejeonella oryzae]
MIIRKAQLSDISTVHELANKIWWPTYHGIIPDDQIAFMLQDMYSENALLNQMSRGYHFLIAEQNSIPVGFASYSLTEPENHVFKLQKLYVLSSEQGKGTGKKLIEEVISIVKMQHAEVLELNVNRGNKAFHFYEKLGFEIYQQVDIRYHQYVLNDFIMRKKI